MVGNLTKCLQNFVFFVNLFVSYKTIMYFWNFVY